MKKLSLFISFLLIISFANSQNLDLNSKIPNDTAVIHGVLPNGLTYYIRHNDNPKNRAELTLAVHSGSIQEDEDQRGLAHLCEHMAFNGTKNYPKHELINFLEKTGMKFGADLNAYTIFDETVYGITVPLDSAQFLDKGLLILHDWAHYVSYENDEIDAERGVVHEEWRMHQGAQFRMQDKLFQAIFKGSKYADRNTIGLMSVVDSCDYSVLKRFYKDWYRTDREAIIVVGDINAKEVEKKIKEIFGTIPKTKNPREYTQVDIPDNDKPIIAIMSDKENPSSAVQIFIKQPKFYIKTVGDYRTYMSFGLFNKMINDRLSELVHSENPPYSYAYAGYSDFIGPKDVFISLAATKDDGILKGAETLLTEDYRIKQNGFTQTEFERAKKSAMSKMEKQYNDRNKQKSKDFVEEYKANFLLTQKPYPGVENEYKMYKKYLDGITLNEVNNLAKKWITEKNMIIVVMAPEKEGVTIPTEEDIKNLLAKTKAKKLEPYVDKVSTRPLFDEKELGITAGKVKKKEKVKEFDAVKWTLSNGVTVILKTTDFKDDEILMKSYSNGGWSKYSQSDDVSSKIACDVIEESGLNGFEKTELDKLLSDKTVNVNPYIDELKEGINGNSSVKDFETMLQLTNLYFTKPRYDKTAYNSYITRTKSMLENQSLSPETAFRDSISAIMANHSMRSRPMSAKMLDEADYKRVNQIYRERFDDPSSFTFLFVGNIDLKKAKPLIEKYLGSLPAVNKNENWKDLGIDFPKGKHDVKAIKGSEPKSIVLMGVNHDFDYNLKDRLTFNALGTILTIDLLDSIREKLSIVYSIGAYPRYDKLPNASATMLVYYPCAPKNIEKATSATLSIFNKIETQGPTDVNLFKAKEELLKKHETNLRENKYWLSTMESYYFNNIPFTEFNKIDNTINSITKDDIKNIAKKFLKTDNYVRVSLVPEK